MPDLASISDAAKSNGDSEIEELCAKVTEDVRSRQVWMNRQVTWYSMRHNGLRRRNKPWPYASDLHFPLIDSTIEKLKPFYFNQIFATDPLAHFVSTDTDLSPFCENLAEWFSYKIREESNLETETLYAIDFMLMAGQCVVGVVWDPKQDCLGFDAIEPLMCIVPDYTKALEEADRVTIVHQLSVEQYKRDKRFKKQDDDFIKSITGLGGTEDGQSNTLEQSKQIREGITHAEKNTNTIIVWNIWEQTDDGWMVHWVSPMQPDVELRPSQKNPFKHGRLPFVRFDMEVKDKSFLGSRGVCEKQAPFENSITKWWNEKSDTMTLALRPIFKSDRAIPNAGNLQMTPGQIIMGNIERVEMGGVSPSFDEEMNSTRTTAEYNIGMPDFGTQDVNKPGNPITATESNKISGLLGTLTDLRSHIFRRSLGKLLQLAWDTLTEFDQDTKYFVRDELKELPPDIDLKSLNDAIKVRPSGSSESWNKGAQLAKAVARKQMFAGDPFINQGELDKSILELDDPTLVKRLYQDPNLKQQSDYEAEGVIIPTLLLGMPMQVLPEDDQAPRIKCLLDFLQLVHLTDQPVSAVGMKGIMNRMNGHIQQLSQKNPKQGAAVQQAVKNALTQHPPRVLPLSPGAAPQVGGSGQPPQKDTLIESIAVKFGDLPPSAQAAFIAKCGLGNVSAEELATHQANQNTQANPTALPEPAQPVEEAA